MGPLCSDIASENVNGFCSSSLLSFPVCSKPKDFLKYESILTTNAYLSNVFLLQVSNKVPNIGHEEIVILFYPQTIFYQLCGGIAVYLLLGENSI